MAESRFVYVTYIKTTPETLWRALTEPEFQARYWLGTQVEADWRQGGDWKLVLQDGRLADTGQIAEFEPQKRLVIRWLHQWRPEIAEEGWSLCTMELEPAGAAVKLTVTHTIAREDSKLIEAVSGGWPQILSNLKSLLETGEPAVSRQAA